MLFNFTTHKFILSPEIAEEAKKQSKEVCALLREKYLDAKL